MRTYIKFLFPLLYLALGYQAVAQEIIQVSEPIVIDSVDLNVEIPHATGGDAVFFAAGAATAVGFSGTSDESELMRLLQRESIRNEIELVDDQYQKMKEYNKRVQQEMKAVMRDMLQRNKDGRIDFDPEAAKSMQAKMSEIKKQAKDELKDMLLPHQIKRLKQVAQQVRMNQLGTAHTLTAGSLADELGLTDEQKTQLREKSAEIEKRLQAEIAKLRADAKKDLFSVLTKQQREKLDEIIGDHFENEESDRLRGMRKMISTKSIQQLEKKLGNNKPTKD